jgi:hypothetical protein
VGKLTKENKMKKLLLVATMLAFSTTAFAANAPVAKVPKAKVVHSACDPVKNKAACKSVVHHKAPKKKK